MFVGKETFGACINRSGNRVGDIATGHTMNILTADFRPRRPFRVGSAGESSHIGWYCGPPFRNDHLIKVSAYSSHIPKIQDAVSIFFSLLVSYFINKFFRSIPSM